MSPQYSIKQINSLESISAGAWNKLSDGSNPFIRHEYLYGLEKYDCLSSQGWYPLHLVVYSDEILVGALPLYVRTNSYGEFVFDWAWADAYEKAGRQYYPKLVSAIPFAPVTGPRLLIKPGFPSARTIKQLLVEKVIQLINANEMSSYHCLFTEFQDQEILAQSGLLKRLTCQFHWFNKHYRDFQDFLDSLTSKKRKQIKRERKQVRNHGIEIETMTGSQISEEQWQVFHNFYCSTFIRRWGQPRLTLEFFQSLGKSMPSSTLLILARHRNSYVAGAYAMLGNDTLYGRHWGCSEQYPFLHFELCYYQTIEYCIHHRLTKIDAGVQGEHKLSRGFSPVAAVSYHWIYNPEFRSAIEQYLERESVEMSWYLDSLNEHLPFKLV